MGSSCKTCIGEAAKLEIQPCSTIGLIGLTMHPPTTSNSSSVIFRAGSAPFPKNKFTMTCSTRTPLLDTDTVLFEWKCYV
ncbi:hypothetical protein BT96DRAFT_376567 [Gymnopus androsaceus JB14]|uniref:Uncharacterized protein n=1 Tax=Gymnopus androsaceus JB14 TaxID=1447944 RepID=A0A6A4IIY6_9AGAR|nr:hypothetical protein BT96DRAFT_376567 [Gymnopus androsaceus JB14]